MTPDRVPVALDLGRLRGTAPRVAGLIAAVALAAVLLPGLRDALSHLAHADARWLALGAALELLSCASYLLLFRPIFGKTLSWRSSYRIAMSGLGVNSLLPVGGAGGLALGAWALRREGLAPGRIASRSVALFLLTSLVNFAAVAVVGLAMASGVLGRSYPAILTLVPALAAIAGVVLVAAIPRLSRRRLVVVEAGTAPRMPRLRTAARVLADGVRDARTLVGRGDLALLAGIVGYWAFDNAVLLATFHAVGAAPPVGVVLMAYLLGQLGNLLPLPGGIGGADGGTIGLLLAFSVPAQSAILAVLAYRAWLLIVPAILATPALIDLRRWASADRPAVHGTEPVLDALAA